MQDISRIFLNVEILTTCSMADWKITFFYIGHTSRLIHFVGFFQPVMCFFGGVNKLCSFRIGHVSHMFVFLNK